MNRVIGEVALLEYEKCQRSAIHGLSDIFSVAAKYAKDNGVLKNDIRVSVWKVETSPDGPHMRCVQDTHPDMDHEIKFLIIPPSLVVPERMHCSTHVSSWLIEIWNSGTILCAVCAGVFVLAETDLLNSRHATTHWAFADELAARYPKIKVDASRMVIDDVDIMTAAGILAWVDLGLTLVDRLLGPSVMLHTARFFIADPPRTRQSVYQVFNPRLQHGDQEIRSAQKYINSRVDQQLTVEDIASSVGMHHRTFQRRFKNVVGVTPTQYIQSIRIGKARELLELTNYTISEISRRVGYADVSTFRKIFLRATGATPSQYRRRFNILDREDL